MGRDVEIEWRVIDVKPLSEMVYRTACATGSRLSMKQRVIPAGNDCQTLDIYEHEPALMPGLAELDNVVLTPHLGSSSWPSQEGMARLVAESVTAALAGHTPPNRVKGT